MDMISTYMHHGGDGDRHETSGRESEGLVADGDE